MIAITDKALRFVRDMVDLNHVNKSVCDAMLMRCPVSLHDVRLADEVLDLLDEYASDNDLERDWWAEEMSLDDFIEML